MGSNRQTQYGEEGPVHKVEISSFYMCIHEVTQKEWLSVMGTLPEKCNSLGNDYPVSGVSRDNAIEYCNKRSIAEGFTPCYQKIGKAYTCDFSANGYRLPTEAEWEYAAKGGKNHDNYIYSGSNNRDEVAWYGDEDKGYEYAVHKVMTKKPNSLGIYDMSGNVAEWCWDRYLMYLTKKIPDTFFADEDHYVLRGRSVFMPESGTITERYPWTSNYPSYGHGLRVVRSGN